MREKTRLKGAPPNSLFSLLVVHGCIRWGLRAIAHFWTGTKAGEGRMRGGGGEGVGFPLACLRGVLQSARARVCVPVCVRAGGLGRLDFCRHQSVVAFTLLLVHTPPPLPFQHPNLDSPL